MKTPIEAVASDEARTERDAPADARRTALLVLGMHRSGTSAITRVMSLLGAQLPARLMPAAEDNNPTGFWESATLQTMHDELLASAGSAWDDWRPFNRQWYDAEISDRFAARARILLDSEFGPAPLLALKDPRICRFAPFWFRLLATARVRACCIVPVRNPLEVAESLSRRDGLSAATSYLLWLRHLLDAELATREHPCAIVAFDQFLLDWRATMAWVGNELGVAWPRFSAKAEHEIDEFLSPSLRHHRRTVDDVLVNSAVCDWVKTAYAQVLRLQTGEDCADARNVLDAVRAEFDRAASAMGAVAWHAQSAARLESELKVKLAAVEQLQHHVAEQDAQLQHAGKEAEQLQQSVAEQDAQLQHARSEAEQLQQCVAERDAQLQLGRTEVEQLGRRVAESDAQLHQERRRVAALESAWAQALADERAQHAAVVQASETLVSNTQRHNAQLARALESTRHDFESLALHLSDIQGSSSWQLAAPLRAFEKVAPAPVRWASSFSKALASALTLRLPARLRLRRTVQMIEGSGLFDTVWYVTTYPEVARSGMRPLLHWLLRGQHCGYNPHPAFDVAYYRSVAQLDAKQQVGEDPLADYLTRGITAVIDPHPLFDTQWYLSQLAGHRREVEMTPLQHYLQFGWHLGLDPHPAFSTTWYLTTHPDVAQAGLNPLQHFLVSGWRERREPSPSFHLNWYLEQYPDIADADLNPFVHYLVHGVTEGRWPGPDKDSTDIRLRRQNALSRVDNPVMPERGPDAGTQQDVHGDSPTGVQKEPIDVSSSPSAVVGVDYVEYAHLTKLYDSFLSSARRDLDGERYVEDDDRGFDAADSAVKVIAFYLPQFHPIPENDAWWGKGFTEWTNVSKAVPQFVGHEQPKLPGELGFYDLRVPEIQRNQAALARRYGIHGFCYHYYWFNGRRLLERPLDQLLADPTLDVPFCICWANENWTRRWDGLDQEILLGQSHTSESDHAFIADVVPLFRDPRYIRVRGRPLLIIYRAGLLPVPEETARRWREHCAAEGIAEPYLVAAQTFGTTDPRPFGFDAAVEFPPHNLPAREITSDLTLLNQNYDGHVYSYRSLMENFSTSGEIDYPRYRCVIPAWDNEARKPGSGNCYAGATPRLYGDWLDNVCQEALTRSDPDERLVFVNAWNEWAEGAYLEPDRRNGYAYLRTTRATLQRLSNPSLASGGGGIDWLGSSPQRRRSDIAVVVHVYYAEVWAEISAALNAVLPSGFDLFVTVADDSSARLVSTAVPANATQCFIAQVANRGRDIAPFVSCLRVLNALDYGSVCKLHTKSISTRADGNEWAQDMFMKLIGSDGAVDAILRAFRADPNLSLLMPTGHALPVEHYWGDRASAPRNQSHLKDCAQAAGLPVRFRGYRFPAGSMYWFRPSALATIARLPLCTDSFPEEHGQTDGTLAHALERLVGLAAVTDGWRAGVTGDVVEGESPTEWLTRGVYPYACATADGAPVQGEVPGIS